jgi:hypothetical protein
MLGLSVVSSSNIDSALQLINAMLDPQTAKQTLTELRDQVAALDRKREEVAALQKQAEQAQADTNAANAALAQRVAELDERDRSISLREQQFKTMRAEVRAKIAGVEA